MLDAKEPAYCYKDYGYQLRGVTCNDNQGDAMLYDLLIEEDGRIMRQYCFSGRNSPDEFSVTGQDYCDILVSIRIFRKLSEDFYS